MATARDRPPEEAGEDTSFARGLRVLLTIADRGEIRADELGTIQPGKVADLVILDRNPLKVKPMAIKDIKVVETIKDGKTIYRAQ